MRSRKTDYDQEAEVLAQYLVKRSAVPRVRHIYADALGTSQASIDAVDAALLRFALRRPASLVYIDAGLSLVRPQSEVRRRLYMVFSILEASPEYADIFLAKPRSAWYVLMFVWVGIRSVCRAVIGVILVRAIAR